MESSKRIYISADYDEKSGDREVVEEIHKWDKSDKYKIYFVDTAEVVSGSVSKKPDCFPCDLKEEFNRQINVSSSVIVVIGSNTCDRTAGSSCGKAMNSQSLMCTPYKQNANGAKFCKHLLDFIPPSADVSPINTYSYLRHEFEQAKAKGKNIVVTYNSTVRHPLWLPSYMEEYEEDAIPFWYRAANGQLYGNYKRIKEMLGYE